MANDPSLAVRKAALTILKADTPLIALVPAASMFTQSPPAAPTMPFLRSGAPTFVPIRATCVDGGDVTMAMHCFSDGRRSGDTLVEGAEDHACHITAAMASALDGQRISYGDGSIRIMVSGTQVMQDPEEASAYHGIVNIRARVIA